MYDDKHRFFGLSSVPTRRVQLFQKGLREFLLCEDCEQQFGRYEMYASKVFYGGTPISGSRRKNSVLLRSLDYKPLKLFFMSLLWRFGVTSIEYYKGAILGPHEARLRQMLLAENPGAYDDYPFRFDRATSINAHGGSLDLDARRRRISAYLLCFQSFAA
jgi:hypothetical protein